MDGIKSTTREKTGGCHERSFGIVWGVIAVWVLTMSLPASWQGAAYAAGDPIVTHGPVVGGVTTTAARVFVRTDQEAAVAIEYGKNSDLSRSSTTEEFVTNSQSDFTRIIDLLGLRPRTKFFLNIHVNGIPQFSPPYPSFTTFPTLLKPQPFTFLVLTDFATPNQTDDEASAFLSASQEDNPAFAFIGGDFYHGNGIRLNIRRQVFKDLYNPDSFGMRDFVTGILWRMPIAHHWDDHDGGADNIDKTFPYWTNSYQAFTEYVPTYPLPSAPPGIWQGFRYAHVDFFVLDNRSQRDPADDPDDEQKSMLDGNALGPDGQLEWLKNGLLASSARWKIIFTSVPTNPGAKPNDSWGAYQTEWNALRSFIEGNGIGGVIFITGDLHMGAIDNGAASGFPEMLVSIASGTPMSAQNGKGCGSATRRARGEWSEGTFDPDWGPCHGYGVVSVLTDPDRVLLEMKDGTGEVKLSYTVF